jgi:CheY-like chemotaxis protein
MPAIPYLLILDDDPEDRDLIAEAFQVQNPEVMIKHAGASEELLSYLGRCAEDDLPTVLLLDYQMPGLNGREVLQALQTDTRYNSIVKVMWSTSQRVKDMQDCKKLGASHYLIKPSSNTELDKLIHQLKAIFDFSSRSRN